MGNWPACLPNYKWPDRLLSIRHAPRQWALALVFHLSHLVGRIAGLLRSGRSILVIRTDGIGDAVLFEPALRSLAESFPGRAIHLWAPAATCELFAGHPAISQTRCVPRGAKTGNLEYFGSVRWRAVLGWHLGRHRFDIAVYAVESPEPLGNWLLSSARAIEKWYAPGDTENQFDWQRSATSAVATKLLESRPGGGHELFRNAHFVRLWGGSASLSPQLHLSDNAAKGLQWRAIAAEAEAVEIIGIMAGSATAVNAYPIASWAAVIRSLWHSRRALCILFGGPADSIRNDQLSKAIEDIPHLRLPTGLNLRATAALLLELDGFISMDTGLAHVALSLDLPTVVIANAGHPGRFFPWPNPKRSVTLTHSMPCQGCLCRCVLAEAECVTRIEPAEVLGAYESIAYAHSAHCKGTHV